MVPNGLQTSLGYAVPPLIGFLILLGLALISLLAGGRQRTNVLFACMCFIGALFNAETALVSLLPDERLALRIDRAVHLFFVFSFPIYIQFVHAFLGIRGRRWLEIAAFLFSLSMTAIIPTGLYISGLNHYSFGRIARAGPLFHLFTAAAAFTVTYCLWLLYTSMRRSRDNLERNRILYIFWGIGISGLLLAFTLLPVSGIPIYPLGNFSFAPAIFLAFGVLKYDLLDIGALIRRGTVYFVLTGILTLLYVLVISLFHAFFLTTGGSDSVFLSLILALIFVLWFNPIKDRVQGLIDRFFFRGRYDYRQILRTISGRLASLLSLPQIRALLVGAIGAALQTERVLLVMAEEEGVRLYGGDGAERGAPAEEVAPLIRLLEREKRPLNRAAAERQGRAEGYPEPVAPVFEWLGADLVVPISLGDGLAGLIALGQKRSGELFVDEDLELLSTIANQAATAIANARSYEALEALNRDLERKVEKRTAALRGALAEKERTQQQLIRSESLAAIGQLVAGTAHELNNPIAGAMSLVESSVDTIASWEDPADKREEVLDDLRFSLGELRRSAAIIRSLLDLSRQTQTYVEAVDMNRAVDDALRVLYNQYKNLPVEIVKDYQGDLPVVEGNFANLGQVLINIIRNALQSLPGGKGRIALETRHEPGSDAVVIECSDTGIGIPARLLKDICKPFFTTKPAGQGTGLGLYLSHEIIRRHGGQLRVASQEGEGTVVTVELPCRRRES